jgi:hypothetical protein
MRKRLYTVGADIGCGRGYRRPPLLNGEPHTGDGAFIRLYVFACSSDEARQRAEEQLRRDRYRVLELIGVEPNGSNKVGPMDNLRLGSTDVARARETGEVLYGWVISYDDNAA